MIATTEYSYTEFSNVSTICLPRRQIRFNQLLVVTKYNILLLVVLVGRLKMKPYQSTNLGEQGALASAAVGELRRQLTYDTSD